MADKINIVAIKPEADRWFNKVAQNIQRNAKSLAPVDSGALKDSIEVEKDTIYRNRYHIFMRKNALS